MCGLGAHLALQPAFQRFRFQRLDDQSVPSDAPTYILRGLIKAILARLGSEVKAKVPMGVQIGAKQPVPPARNEDLPSDDQRQVCGWSLAYEVPIAKFPKS